MADGIKYPLPCGCHGPKFLSMCIAHQEADVETQQRLMGIGRGAEVMQLREELAHLRALLRQCITTVEDPVLKAHIEAAVT